MELLTYRLSDPNDKSKELAKKMCIRDSTRATEFYWVQTRPLEFGLLALWMIVVLAVGRGLFVRKEV